MRPYVSDVLRGCGFADEEVFWGPAGLNLAGQYGLVRRLRRDRFDLAVLLTNSFRSGLVARLADIPRRLGYARDGRSWLLTDRVSPPRTADGTLEPVSAVVYYNALVRRLDREGDPVAELPMRLAVSEAESAALTAKLGELAQRRPLIVLNPGANYGSAKCWPAEKYAALSDRLVRELDATVIASLSPREQEIADRLRQAAREPLHVFVDLGIALLRALVQRCDLLVTNDTGPRHFAPAFEVPVVTIFGSSDPAWSDGGYQGERIVKLDLDCQPCMARTCPLKHHACMRDLGVDVVFAAASQHLCRTYRGDGGALQARVMDGARQTG